MSKEDMTEVRALQNEVQALVNKWITEIDSGYTRDDPRSYPEELLLILIGENKSGGGSCGEK